MGTKPKKSSNKKVKFGKIIGKKGSNLTILLLILLLAIALLYAVSQRMSADSTSTVAMGTATRNTNKAITAKTMKEVGTIKFSGKVVDKTDNAKVVAGQAVTIYTNGSNTRSNSSGEMLTSNAQGLVSSGDYSICTSDSNLYTIMTKGCLKKVTKISLNTTPANAASAPKRISNSYRKQHSISIGNASYIEPQFKEKFTSVSGGIATGIAGQWTTPTSLIYSDNSGVKVVENKIDSKKLYEVGSIDFSIMVVSKTDKTKGIVGQYVAVEPASITYRKVRQFLSSKTVTTPTSLSSLNLKGGSGETGIASGGHYSICIKGSNLRYYIMDAGCKSSVDRLSIFLTNAGGEKLAKVTTLNQGVNRSGGGYSAAEFGKVYIKKDGTTSSEIKGEWKTINNVLLYSDGSGGKTL